MHSGTSSYESYELPHCCQLYSEVPPESLWKHVRNCEIGEINHFCDPFSNSEMNQKGN